MSLIRPASFLRALCLAALLVPQAAVQAAEKLTICYVEVSSALVPLAKLKDFYAAEGLDVEVRFMPTGVLGMEAMFKGECALATAADSPMVHFSQRRDDFRVVATIAQLNNYARILARTDRGIARPADLRGKRIATARFTIAHAFLDSFLIAHGLQPGDVTQVYLSPKEMDAAFRHGEVDAVSFWVPQVVHLAQEFGNRAKEFAVPGLQIAPIVLMGGRDFIRSKPDTLTRVLRALLRAERFAREQPAAARQLLATQLNLPLNEIETTWPVHDYRVRLDQSLPFMLENNARWQNGLLPPAERRSLPNYLDFIDPGALQAIAPDAVTLVR